MRKLVLFMHVSADGFVADAEGSMSWVHVDEDIFDYAAARTNAADTALYGRKTYEMMQAYWPTAADKPNPSRHDVEHSQWYNKVHKVIMSASLRNASLSNTTIISDNIGAQIEALKQRPGGEIIIFGSPSAAHTLMRENLIDEYWLFVNPVLLGSGTPVFKNIVGHIPLRLAAAHTFSSGVVCLHYQKQTS